MDNFLKRESKMEEAQYCQPCGHSPGPERCTVVVSCRSANQPSFVANESLACPVCWKLYGAQASTPQEALDNFCTTSEATSGLRLAIMGNASAHDAQNAAGAHRSAERKPNPPIRIGSVESFLSSSSLSVGISPNNALAFIMGLAIG